MNNPSFTVAIFFAQPRWQCRSWRRDVQAQTIRDHAGEREAGGVGLN